MQHKSMQIACSSTHRLFSFTRNNCTICRAQWLSSFILARTISLILPSSPTDTGHSSASLSMATLPDIGEKQKENHNMYICKNGSYTCNTSIENRFELHRPGTTPRAPKERSASTSAHHLELPIGWRRGGEECHEIFFLSSVHGRECKNTDTKYIDHILTIPPKKLHMTCK